MVARLAFHLSPERLWISVQFHSKKMSQFSRAHLNEGSSLCQILHWCTSWDSQYPFWEAELWPWNQQLPIWGRWNYSPSSFGLYHPMFPSWPRTWTTQLSNFLSYFSLAYPPVQSSWLPCFPFITFLRFS